MSRFLIFSLTFFMVITGMIYFGLEGLIEDELEKSILKGYPGTEKADVNVEIGWLQDEINSFKIDIENWQLNEWQVNNFHGEFINVKINWLHLLRKKTLVVEKIDNGQISATIDNDNLNAGIKNYYPGLKIALINGEVKVDLVVSIFGKELNAYAFGDLIPAQGASIAFKPRTLTVAGYRFSGAIQENIIKKLNFKLSLEKIPFYFQVTNVNIMQDKILIKGKV